MTAEQVVEQIKRLAPASLKVTLRDGTEKPVAMPKSGNRWSRTLQTLEALPWVVVECLDKDGKLLGVIEDDEEMNALPDDDHPDLGIARVLLEVMRTTMKEQRLTFDAQLAGQAKLLSGMTDAMGVIAESYKLAMNVQASHMLAQDASGGNPEVMQMMQMALAMMNQQPKQLAKPPEKKG